MASIRKQKNSYLFRVSCGYDTNGKQIVKSMTWKPDKDMTARQAEKEATRQAAIFEEQCKNGMTGNHRNMKLSEFCIMYLDIKRDILAPRTWHDYSRTIDSLIVPLLGHMKISDIKPSHVQQFIHYLQGNVKLKKDGSADTENPKLSNATIKRKLTVLQSIFRQAVKLDIISSNPANTEKLTIPKTITPKIEIFSKQEAVEMLSCLENEPLQFQVLIQLAIMTGCRCGELVGLKFSDIDYQTNKITVERSAYKVSGQPTNVKPPKDYEIRTITINSHCIELIRLLKAEKEKQAMEQAEKWHDEDWLFTQHNGEIMNPQTPTKQFSKFLKKHGLKHRKFHSLRHTSATLLLYGGVNLKQVQERLGHGDISTTNKYLHCIAEADEEASNVLQNMLITKRTVKALEKIEEKTG